MSLYTYINFNKYPATTPKYPNYSLIINLKPHFGNLATIAYEVEQLFEAKGISKEEIAEFYKEVKEAPTPEDALLKIQEWAYVCFMYVDSKEDYYYDAEKYLY